MAGIHPCDCDAFTERYSDLLAKTQHEVLGAGAGESHPADHKSSRFGTGTAWLLFNATAFLHRQTRFQAKVPAAGRRSRHFA
jgi:hypothetical protein